MHRARDPGASAKSDIPTQEAPRKSQSAFWGLLTLALVGVTLLGSVAIPARQTLLITRLLRETTDVLAPARLLVEELQTGLARELTALQSYALSGDDEMLGRYTATAVDDWRSLAALERLATRFDTAAAGRVYVIGGTIGEWRLHNDALIVQRVSRPQFAAALEAGQAQYDSSLKAISELSSALAAEAATRDDRVSALEQLSIVVNAALVLAALMAMSGVLVLALRERRLSDALHRRVVEESALRQLARRLSAVVTRDEALRCAAEGALVTTHARGASVEWRTSRKRMIAFVATADEGAPAPITRAPYSGSLTEEIVGRGGPPVSGKVDTIDGRLTAHHSDGCGRYDELVIPLLSAHKTRGALILRGDPAAPSFGENERRQLRLVSDLASAALRRVDGRAAVQRALREARGRARREAALREAAESLAGANTADEVTQRIARAALHAMRGRGAFVERIVGRPGEAAEAIVCAVAGTGVPPLETKHPLAGSYTELVTTRNASVLLANPAQLDRSGTLDNMQDRARSAIAVPLGGATTPMGALYVVGSARSSSRSDDMAGAGIFGHLAALAYEKAFLLDEAHERRLSLERVIQSRSRLMRGFSHDVKNPIGAADGFAELLSLGVFGDLSTEQRASIERIRRSIRAALELITELTVLASAESGTIALSTEPVDLAALVRDLGEEYHAAALGRGLSLSIDVGSGQAIIETDRARVQQIAANLLANAIKYTQRGSVLVRTHLQPADSGREDDAWAIIEFTDSGPGIPPDKKDYIFEEFSRLGGGDTPGAGLGLAISKVLAQALGGRITVESELGHGSTFTLWLPPRRPAGTA